MIQKNSEIKTESSDHEIIKFDDPSLFFFLILKHLDTSERYQYIYAWKPRWYKCRERAWLKTKGNKWEILVTQARIPKGKQKGKDLKECGNIFILFTTLSPAPSTSYAFSAQSRYSETLGKNWMNETQ